ncbi:hypothetical protein JTB14_024952 [Gonioctena quinquepunctata]|nr:hypothetical protein JTB14_024952 [Gonioctena quinquepunctata]
MKFILVLFIFLIPCTLGIISERENSALKMITGSEILEHSMPYLAFLRITGTDNINRCGGTLISRNYVLTSARCVAKASSVEVIFGVHSISATTENHVSLVSSNFTIHYNFNETTLENDIALITLPEAVTLSDEIQPIAIANEYDEENLSGKLMETAGWGLQSSTFNDTYSDVPLGIFLRQIPNYEGDCYTTFKDKIQYTNICCGSHDGHNFPTNICDGDFGGPLVVDGKLVGIASFTSDICDAGHPNVFTNVAEYRTWILVYSDAIQE